MTHLTIARTRSLSNPNVFSGSKENILVDPGNHPDSHFEPHMSPLRFKMRSYLLQYTDSQSTYLAKWQQYYRSDFLDIYFSYSASLASHTFYVICLPIPVFFDQYNLVRDLVYIIGSSIYLSGFLKDYWCLPRPQSPPVKRITLSEYTSKEYGAPSSHTANAVGVTLLFLLRIWQHDYISIGWKLFYLCLAIFYNLTLVLGRVYCGMHGILDITSGAIIGVICFLARLTIPPFLKSMNFHPSEYLLFPMISTACGLFILLYQTVPIDVCPCFDDTVAFIGVLVGMDVSHWAIERYSLEHVVNNLGDLERASTLLVSTKFLLGVILVVVWKYALSKPFLIFLLKNILRIKDDRKLIEAKVTAWQAEHPHECAPYFGRSKFEIYLRFLSYIGIPLTVLLFCPYLFTTIGLIVP
ncbi:hypothetical protein TPHA_0B03070 [Tetrapisispora phaffii CBS 4417]|uniref:Phosphatidic acid phosphatase type 2/haloperoxidase domain-containing protein n=1 Tax=Tetrapisispora phaffii (strain ATCC 24235 / CBS 4417 / NBRC 1672 / NRRL Y-8282 / UCD 70-5) TaxID=1071381 RepID=G8BPP8_TETPH|nr:hypothetical protein TPHA_0B03070 [Tetrapisispora phaffii CBS 4417]CCE61979.1 hypothetical protein TPHA_0B03070 [Tetrapisispora phaffii CBS 4417]